MKIQKHFFVSSADKKAPGRSEQTDLEKNPPLGLASLQVEFAQAARSRQTLHSRGGEYQQRGAEQEGR